MTLISFTKKRSLTALLLCAGAFLLTKCLEDPVIFCNQSGTDGDDQGIAIAVDGSHVYVVGHTTGDLDGNLNLSKGESDVFLTKYTSSGERVWTQLLGSTKRDLARDIAVDQEGNIIITGETNGNFNGHTYSGYYDIFLAKYSTTGHLLWSTQIGTEGIERANGLAVDHLGNIYITGDVDTESRGFTSEEDLDIFLMKLDEYGDVLWERQLASEREDRGTDVTVGEDGSVYVTGYTFGSIDGQPNSGGTSAEIVLAKYDASGNKQWVRLWGSEDADYATRLTTDSDENIYIVGNTWGRLDDTWAGIFCSTFLAKFNADGEIQWSDVKGSILWDEARDVVVDDERGRIVVTGFASGMISGSFHYGKEDIYIAEYTTSGEILQSGLIGSSSSDRGEGISIDSDGNVYVTGLTLGELRGNPAMGERDIFLMKLGS